METKITKKEYFEMIKGVVADRADLVEFCDKQIGLLTKKSSKPTKNQLRNAELAEVVYNFMLENQAPAKASEILEGMENDEIKTVQKLVPILKALVADGRVVKVQDKKEVFYSVVVSE